MDYVEKTTSSTEPHMRSLPWEQVESPAADKGICLSGGGLRAASFSFGVLQALQEKLGLVYGPMSAQYLSAVSGGSYIAATYALGARHRALHPKEYEVIPLLAEGSPEEAHILSHGGYLGRNWVLFAILWLRFGFLGVLNFLALITLFVWVGVMLADMAIIRPWISQLLNEVFISRRVGDLLSAFDFFPIFLLTGALALIIFPLIRCLFAEEVWRRRLLPLPLMVLLLALCRPVLSAAASYEHWWSPWNMVIVIATMVLALFLLAGVMWLAEKLGITGVLAHGLNTLAIVGPRVLGFYLLACSAVHGYSFLLAGSNNTSEAPILFLAAFFLILVGALVFSHVPHRVSLHREYRSRIHSCFGVRRNGEAASVVDDPLLSELGPPMEDTIRFPRLLICATANVHVRTGRGRFRFVPFVFSHDMCGVPGHSGATLPTAKLELQREPAGILTFRKEPLLSLFTAVAATGAAVAPSMGRYTIPSLRALVAAFNIRLGRWFPNPFSVRARQALNNANADDGIWLRIKAWAKKDRRLGPGYNELVPEILGFDGPRVYVSDGGHYDNLGLLALLGAKCAEIWCVDASPEPSGQAAEVDRVSAIAWDKMGIDVDIDLKRFAATRQGFYPFTHATGEITYPDRSTGRLFIVKLGLAQESPDVLRERRHKDRGFPHHSTRKQVYSTDRMDAYRNLGYDSALRCLRDYAPSPS